MGNFLTTKQEELLHELVRLGFCYTEAGSELEREMIALVGFGLARKKWFKREYEPTDMGRRISINMRISRALDYPSGEKE